MKLGWEKKATIARVCARLPYGHKVYKLGQKRFGRLRADPRSRLSKQIEMVRWLVKYGMGVFGKQFLEVGTGHIPVVPIGFYLAGAEQTITVDVNRRIDWSLTRQAIEWMASHKSALAALYRDDIVPSSLFDERFAALVEFKSAPKRFFDRAKIQYLAPSDAANTNLPAESVDCHYSVTVLEHIPQPTLRDILTEAKRILRSDGFALHFIDPSDHFQHQDRSIAQINFLKYSDEEWSRLAGNQFAYCNRLRASDFLKLISDLNFGVVHSEAAIDQQSRDLLRRGFLVDARFRHYSPDDLCTTSLRVMLRNSG